MKLLSLTRSAVTLFLLGGGAYGGSIEINKQRLRRVVSDDDHNHNHRFVTTEIVNIDDDNNRADQLRDYPPVVDIIRHSFDDEDVKVKNDKSVVRVLVGDNEEDDPRNLQTNTCPGFDTSIEVDFDTTGEFITVITGSTIGEPASLPNLSGCVTDSGAPTKWYKFTTTVDSFIGITTCSEATNFDTTISIFAHSDDVGCFAFCLGQNDNHGTTLDFCPSSEHSLAILEASATTYYIAVSGQQSWDQGNFELILFAIPPDDNGGATGNSANPTPRPTTNRPTFGPTPRPTTPPPPNTDDGNSNTPEPTPSPTKASPAAPPAAPPSAAASPLTNDVQQGGSGGDEINFGLVFGLVAVGIVLIFIIVVITWVLVRKNNEKNEDNKKGEVEGNNVNDGVVVVMNDDDWQQQYRQQETADFTDHSNIVVATGMASQNTKLGIALARLEDKNGIFISQISEKSSIFSGQGLREGMIVKRINGIPVSTVEQAKGILTGYQGMLTIEAEYPQQEKQHLVEADF